MGHNLISQREQSIFVGFLVLMNMDGGNFKRIISFGSEEIGTKRYNSLEISPVHIHKDKKAHKDALLTLGDEIVTHIHGRNIPVGNYSSDTASTKVAAEH